MNQPQETKEGWEEETPNKKDWVIILRDKFIPRITATIEKAQGGYEDREDLGSVISDLIRQSNHQTEQRVARNTKERLIEWLDAQAFESDNGSKVELFINWDEVKPKLINHHYNINE